MKKRENDMKNKKIKKGCFDYTASKQELINMLYK